MKKAIRSFDGMDVYRAHLALQHAGNNALIHHHQDHGDFYLRQCKENFAEAAAYLGLELVEVVSTDKVDNHGNNVEAVVAVQS